MAPTYIRESVEKRLLERREITDSGCWLWTGTLNSQGYGKIYTAHAGRYWLCHRIAYTIWVSPIPDGMQVLHRCDRSRCYNPAHLWIGTQSDNTRDAAKKGRSRGGKPSTLTVYDVREIRRLRREGMTYAKIAARFSISSMSAWDVANYKSWKYADDPKWERADLSL